jgi:hypothetical protein
VSPLCIEILLHYHCRADDYRNGDHTAPAVKDALNWFLSHDMIRHEGFNPEFVENGVLKARYALTARGKAFVEYLQMIPPPTASWSFGQVSWRGMEGSEHPSQERNTP